MTDPREELRLAGERRDEDVAAIQDPEAAREADILAQEALAAESAARTARLGDAADLAAIRGRRQWPLPKQADPGAPLLVVKDLRTHFKLQSGWVKAVDGVSFRLNPARRSGWSVSRAAARRPPRFRSWSGCCPRTDGSPRAAASGSSASSSSPKTEDQLRRTAGAT